MGEKVKVCGTCRATIRDCRCCDPAVFAFRYMMFPEAFSDEADRFVATTHAMHDAKAVTQ